MVDTAVEIYYGPSNWFNSKIEDKAPKTLASLLDRQEGDGRILTLTQAGQNVPPKKKKKKSYSNVAVLSNDYASWNEHVITNFTGILRKFKIQNLYVQNPPAAIRRQLEREYSSVKSFEYPYPQIDLSALQEIKRTYSEHLIGQEQAKDLILAGLYSLIQPDRAKPVVLMLYGPSGVGKTEAARLINSSLGGVLMRKQFSMYQNAHFGGYLFGASHSEPSLAHDLLERESGVVLLDEFDKANPIFHSAFYQFFEDGTFEDKNYEVKLGASVIICTSNYQSEADIKEALGEALFSRFDAFIPFAPLTQGERAQVINQVFDKQVDLLNESEKQHLDLDSIRDQLQSMPNSVGNVRQIGKITGQLISLKLIRSMLK